jgi:hypothetical protein
MDCIWLKKVFQPIVGQSILRFISKIFRRLTTSFIGREQIKKGKHYKRYPPTGSGYLYFNRGMAELNKSGNQAFHDSFWQILQFFEQSVHSENNIMKIRSVNRIVH